MPTPEWIETGCEALTSSGGIVRIRRVAPGDAAQLRRLHERASEQGLSRDRESADGDAAIVAVLDDRIVGAAGYERRSGPQAQATLLVDAVHHGEGIGTLLLEHLAAFARHDGIEHLVADTLAANIPMLRVLADVGLPVEREVDRDVVHVRIGTEPDESTLAAMDERERRAELRSLAPLLAPRTVAVVGASRRPGRVGHEVVRSLVAAGFTGRIFPVNPNAANVAGLPCYPGLDRLPEPAELAVVATPAGLVAQVLDDCAACGVRAGVVLSSGFEPGSGPVGKERLARTARRGGIRLVGPNCIGVVNTDPDVRLDATFTPSSPRPGSLALASQSGAVGIAVLDVASRLELGISSFVSLGDRLDVSSNDLLLYWDQDPNTRVIALYLESFGNPRKFARIARRVATRKPVLAVKGGRSEGGRRAGASHTAAAATPDVAVDALFAQAGVVRLDTVEELLDAARLLALQPLPPGGRLAIVGNAGGAGVLAADAAHAGALEVPRLSADVRERLARELPDAAAVDNPVDLGAAANPEAFAAAARAVLDSGEVDALVLVFAATLVGDADAVLDTIAAIPASRVPVAATLIGLDAPPAALRTTSGARIPAYGFPERAVRALGVAVRYAQWRHRPRGRVPELGDVDADAARRTVSEILRDRPTGGWVDAAEAAQLLRSYGVPLAAATVARSADEAVAAAARLGYPVVLKAADPELVHKTELGGVRLGLETAEEVRAAYAGVRALSADVLVQPTVSGDVELVVGVVQDPAFGPLVMFGVGGVHTEVFADRTFRILPVTDTDAMQMVRSLRASPLLFGHRGTPGVDVAALEDLLLRVARLADDVPELAELDLNPVFASGDGVLAVDVKLRLAPAPAAPDPYVRRLG